MYLINLNLNEKIKVNENVGKSLLSKKIKKYDKITEAEFYGIEEKEKKSKEKEPEKPKE